VDLTKRYLLWKLGALSRDEIIFVVDLEICNTPNPDQSLLDISLGASVDDYEFGKLLRPHVDEGKIGPNDILTVVATAVRFAISKNSFSKFKSGLEWLFYDRYGGDPGSSIGYLYYNLDHLLTEAIPQGYAKSADVTAFIEKWLLNPDPAA